MDGSAYDPICRPGSNARSTRSRSLGLSLALTYLSVVERVAEGIADQHDVGCPDDKALAVSESQ
jgi:hypothetical protein